MGKPAYRHKTNKGSLFENEKQKETQPDFKGTIDIEGTIYWISGWKAMSSAGKKRISLSVQKQEERHPSEHGNEEHGWGGDFTNRTQAQRPQQQRRQNSGW